MFVARCVVAEPGRVPRLSVEGEGGGIPPEVGHYLSDIVVRGGEGHLVFDLLGRQLLLLEPVSFPPGR